MEPANEAKATRRPRRSKADIEEAIMKAAVAQIKKKGFSLALVTDIVKKAKIEPIVFYNRYKNLGEFYDEFVKKYDYWLSDFVRDNLKNMDSPGIYGDVLDKLMRNLLDDPIMVEILRWEISEGNHITERTARLRELHSQELIVMAGEVDAVPAVDVVAVSALLIAGIYFLVLHKDRSTFGGIDLNTDDGKRRVADACSSIGQFVFSEIEAGRERERIAERLRAQGVSEEIIANALGR